MRSGAGNNGKAVYEIFGFGSMLGSGGQLRLYSTPSCSLQEPIMLHRLSEETAGAIEVSHRLPNRRAITPGIVHLGLGAFHRAHQALITDECMADTGDMSWGIVAANIHSREQPVIDMQAQDNLYTVTETSDHVYRHKLVSAIVETVFALPDRSDLLNRMSDKAIRIVSMTITEKGYFTDPDSGELLTQHPDIQFDIKNPQHPKTAIGLAVCALGRRKNLGLPPFTLMSCDNIPQNGQRLRSAVLQLAEKTDSELARWVAANCTFPSTMVDRIVPAMTEETLANVVQALGVIDRSAVVCEPFIQWIIEDHFVSGRPDWHSVSGVSFVEDVRPFEQMKLRMLNGSHSFLAYLGYLDGYRTISETVANADYRAATEKLMTKVAAPTLKLPDSVDLNAYANQLIKRFSNPELAHRNWQIAMDGSQKIPQRWLETVRWHIKEGSDYSLLALALAGWMQFVSGKDLQGNPIDVSDPMADSLQQIASQHLGNTARMIREFLSIRSIFGEQLPVNMHFLNQVTEMYRLLTERGGAGTLTLLLSENTEFVPDAVHPLPD